MPVAIILLVLRSDRGPTKTPAGRPRQRARNDFFPLALKVASYNGKLYGVPQTVHPHLLWYRTDIYDGAATKDNSSRPPAMNWPGPRPGTNGSSI